MKKVFKITVISLLLGAMIISLVGCGSARSKLVGKWVASERRGFKFSELEIFSDGTYTSDHPNYSGSYSIDGDRIKFSGILVETLTLSFKIDGDTLSLYYDGNENPCAVFTKQSD